MIDPVDREEIQTMTTNIHQLYLAAQQKLNEAREAERVLRQKMQEVYIIVSLIEEEGEDDKNHTDG